MENVQTHSLTAAELYEQQKVAFLTTGCPSIDNCLKGGIIRNSITEVFYIIV